MITAHCVRFYKPQSRQAPSFAQQTFGWEEPSLQKHRSTHCLWNKDWSDQLCLCISSLIPDYSHCLSSLFSIFIAKIMLSWNNQESQLISMMKRTRREKVIGHFFLFFSFFFIVTLFSSSFPLFFVFPLVVSICFTIYLTPPFLNPFFFIISINTSSLLSFPISCLLFQNNFRSTYQSLTNKLGAFW